jgi:hypothetical protein
MKPFMFSEYAAEWMKTFRTMFPGGAASAAKEPTPKEELVAAKQEWEGEGGNVRPEKK